MRIDQSVPCRIEVKIKVIDRGRICSDVVDVHLFFSYTRNTLGCCKCSDHMVSKVDVRNHVRR